MPDLILRASLHLICGPAQPVKNTEAINIIAGKSFFMSYHLKK
jgi:hypothetical protein